MECLRKDWITQFKGRRSLLSGDSSKSPEFLPKLRLSDLGHKCSAPLQGNPYQQQPATWGLMGCCLGGLTLVSLT